MALAFPLVLALVAVATLLFPAPAWPSEREVEAAPSLEATIHTPELDRSPAPSEPQAASQEADSHGPTPPEPTSMPRGAEEAPDQAASPPIYFMPVEGVKVADVPHTFGDPRGANRTHLGVDILAERGTPIRAAAPGEVWRANEAAISVTVIGDDGVRYFYTHLDSIAPGIERGSRVGTDTVLGYVGNTGNAAATAPHLHFEVALPVPGQRYSWEPIDPLKYMLDR